mmetsp:Transcript_43706/g.71037  ORF Transcript_43706/g.71037 Transcript_43706/m.71037 type:complete len:453 (+) Transcript_43706:165-1523(+)
MAEDMKLSGQSFSFSSYLSALGSPQSLGDETRTRLQFSPEKLVASEQDTAYASLEQINSLLIANALPALSLVSCNADVTTSIIRTVSSLLQLRQHDVQYRDQVDDRLVRLQSDLKIAQTNHSRLAEKLEIREREFSQLLLKERALDATFKKEKEKWQIEKEEFTKQLKDLQHRDGHHVVAARKAEREYSKLQERLQGLLHDRMSKESKVDFAIHSMLKKEKRGTWNNPQKAEVEMGQILMNQFQERQDILLTENGQLRDALRVFVSEMHRTVHLHPLFLETNKGSQAKNEDDDKSDFSIAQLELPFDMFHNSVDDFVKNTLVELRNRLDRLEHGRIQAGMASIGNVQTKHTFGDPSQLLSEQIASLQEIINEQDRLIRFNITTTPQVDVLTSRNDDTLESEHKLDKERAELLQKAIELDRSRLLLEMERSALDNHHSLTSLGAGSRQTLGHS